jgi:hypothetical protein
MIGKYKFDIQTYYPHMKPADVHLWEKFIRANSGFFDSVDYDVCVGDVPDWINTMEDALAEKEKKLYQKKIDVVGYKDDLVWLVEVKPFAGSDALGQILSYEILYKKDNPEAKNIRLLVITNKLQNNYDKIYALKDIQVAEVGICPECARINY